MEVWEVIERRQDSALRRLRNFLDQFRAPGYNRHVTTNRIFAR